MLLNQFVKKMMLALVCIAVICVNIPYDNEAYAGVGDVTATLQDTSTSGTQGSKTTVIYKIKNERDYAIVVKNMQLEVSGAGIEASQNTGELTINQNEETSVSFTLTIGRNASLGDRTIQFKADMERAGGVSLGNLTSRLENFTVYEKFATDGHEVGWVAAVDVSHTIKPASGFTVGGNNKLSLTLYNYGNSVVKNGSVKITLPEGLSINNGSNQANIGYLSTGQKQTVDFPISVEDGTQSKNYPIEVTVQGQDFMRGEVKGSKTLYIPVVGAGKEDIKNDLNITNVTAPNVVAEKSTFNVSFSVTNSGKTKLRSIKITAEPAEGLLNRSRNIFVDSFDPGQTKTYTISYFAKETKEGKSCAIKINAESTNSDAKNAAQVSQYAVVTVEASADDGVKKPQLMVDGYTYGGTAVQAGGHFILNLGILNTSTKELANIKVSLTDEGGVFVPAGGSNSFFIDKIRGKAHYTKSMAFDVKPQAEQKTTSMTVKISYETKDGEALESSDVIAIPVTQRTRLVIDDFVPPQEAYVGSPVSCELQFYNMGKTVLNNLKINCSGDFDVTQSNSYYAGNMEAGKSDTYSFTVVPREVGTVTGTVSFTFEDSEGESQIIEVPFEFEATKEQIIDDNDDNQKDNQKKAPWSLIIFGIIVASLIISVIVVKKIRKNKMHKDLEIDDLDV